jgi:hypothetical protein
MTKKNSKEKLTYKQMLSYMDFLNNKMNNKFVDIDNAINGLGYYLKTYVEFSKKDKKFIKFLDKKQKEAEKLGSDAQIETPKSEKG